MMQLRQIVLYMKAHAFGLMAWDGTDVIFYREGSDVPFRFHEVPRGMGEAALLLGQHLALLRVEKFTIRPGC